MIERKTTLDKIEILADGTVQIRMGLLLLENGEPIGSTRWHRTTIPPGGDVGAQMSAVNAHLGQMKEKPLPNTEIERIRKFVALAKV